MTLFAFTDQRERVRRIVANALTGAIYDTSREDGDRLLLVEAHRADGRRVNLRFRGVSKSDATAKPEAGASIGSIRVGSAEKFSLLRLFLPLLRGAAANAVRVRIEAGTARLDIVCEDAEWWEPDRPDAPGGGNP